MGKLKRCTKCNALAAELIAGKLYCKMHVDKIKASAEVVIDLVDKIEEETGIPIDTVIMPEPAPITECGPRRTSKPWWRKLFG